MAAAVAALVVAAGFALGLYQAIGFRTASSRINNGRSDARAAALLRSAARLNPDTQVAVERARLSVNQGHPAEARRRLLGVVRAEPENAYAWGAIEVLLVRAYPALARRAAARFERLVPQVPAP